MSRPSKHTVWYVWYIHTLKQYFRTIATVWYVWYVHTIMADKIIRIEGVPEDVYRQIKVSAASKGQTLKAWMLDAIGSHLGIRIEPRKAKSKTRH